ncbi:glyoxalase superfamily protein [Algicella marina]|uniref:Glyoxalase-related protein domain-containing protein n=1 Tax=Algicella marina TaxID=2683284 RepID=A0A6P1T331_9RHOB|nr:glyoxalase superfamily protein [Algicella marina]QHQ36161.1 hypothetical protein GO499_13775 [Algicella marina]
MSLSHLTLDGVKAQAKGLRRALGANGYEIAHGRALELVAQQYGFRDWNTLHARVGNAPPVPIHVGQQITGRYLGKPFKGDVIAVRSLGDDSKFALTLHFDRPIDVVEFDNFSNFRSRVSVVVDREGRTAEKTSNGEPHMALDTAVAIS